MRLDVKEVEMKKVEVLLSSGQLVQKMDELATGRGGLLVVPADYWKMIIDAYDSPLVRRVDDVAMLVCPVRVVETKELKFRAEIKLE